jgi:UDP-N-acetylglucosamine--N-acetylmuramyl-(pentapeptide) pyrophosphoryl-undecaprenol N-acetylglucosamine transferase
MTCAELAAVGLPAVYVPLPIGNGEQRLNALPVVEAGGGLIIDDHDLDPAELLHHVLPLLLDADQRHEMAAAAASHGQRDADERLRALVLAAVAAGPAASDDGTHDDSTHDAGGPA